MIHGVIEKRKSIVIQQKKEGKRGNVLRRKNKSSNSSDSDCSVEIPFFSKRSISETDRHYSDQKRCQIEVP